jgi:hypothetical protein
MPRVQMLRRRLGIVPAQAEGSIMSEQTVTHSAVAKVPTAHASRYLQQLCKHWAHNLAVEFTPERGAVRFPRDARGANWAGDGVFIMTADSDALLCRIDASEAAQLEGLKGAVERHLDRFAFRESPLVFDWQPA